MSDVPEVEISRGENCYWVVCQSCTEGVIPIDVVTPPDLEEAEISKSNHKQWHEDGMPD